LITLNDPAPPRSDDAACLAMPSISMLFLPLMRGAEAAEAPPHCTSVQRTRHFLPAGLLINVLEILRVCRVGQFVLCSCKID